MKKSIKLLVSLILVFTVSTTLSASSLVRDITGKENKGITVKYNNQVQNLKDGHGEAVYPVIIDGSTYLPVRAIADMLGASITWDGKTKTISIKGNSVKVDGAVPTDLPSANNNNSSKTPTKPPKDESNNVAKNLGTRDNPVKLGSVFSFHSTDDLGSVIKSADYEVSIAKVEPITGDEIESLGFVKPENNTLMKYVMITMNLDVSNVEYIGDEYVLMCGFKVRISGSETKDGMTIIGGTDYGFDGSLQENVSNTAGFEEIHEGDTGGYSTSGKVLLPIYKNTDNYLLLDKGIGENGEYYFELQ